MTDQRNQYDDFFDKQAPAAPSRAKAIAGKYDRYLDARDQHAAQVNVLDAPNPDDAARANRYQRDMGVPAALAQDDIKNYDAMARQREVARLAGQLPAFAKFMADPRNAAVAHDDNSALGTIGKIFQTYSNQPAPAPTARPKTWTQSLLDAPRNVASSLYAGVGQASQGLVGIAKAAIEVKDQIDPFNWIDYAITGRVGRGGMPGSEKTAAEKEANGTAMLDRIIGLQQNEITRSTVNDEGFIGNSIYSGIQSIPSSVASLVDPALGLPMMGVTTGGQNYVQARAAGVSPVNAATYGARQGATEVLTEKLGPSGWIDGLKAGSPFLKRMGQYLYKDVGGELLATTVQNFDQWATIEANQGKTFGDYVKQLPADLAQTAIAAITTGAATTGAVELASKTAERIDHAVTARRSERALAGVMDAAAASKLRKRDPEAFKQFVSTATEGTLTENAYVPVEAIDTLMQTEGFEDQDGFFGALQQQIVDARATGGDVVIPVSDIASKLAGTPAWDALKDDTRLEAGGLSPKEMRVEGDAILKTIQTRGDEIAKAADSEATRAEPARQVFDEVKGQLTGIGRSDREATNLAAVYAARAEAWGERLGVSATDYHAKYPVEFKSDVGTAQAAAPNVMEQGIIGVSDSDRKKFSNPRDIGFAKFILPDGRALASGDETHEYVSDALGFGGGEAGVKAMLSATGAIRVGAGGGGDIHIASKPTDAQIATLARYIKKQFAPLMVDAEYIGAYGEVSTGSDLNRLLAAPLEQNPGNGARGQIALGANGTNVITLFENANLSTLLHETGHQFLEELQRNAADPAAPDSVREDWEKVKAWFVENGVWHGDAGSTLEQSVGGLSGFLRDVDLGALTRLTRGQNRARTALEKKPAIEAVVPLQSLTGTQSDVNDDFTEAAARRAGETDGMALPAVFKVGGRLLVGDGHHRLAAAAVRGDTTAKVRIFDIDGAMGEPPLDPSIPLFELQQNGKRKGDDAGMQIPREAHELWARGFERYAMEGKAPSSALQSAFAAFRGWLLRIYQVVQNLRAPITPGVREVMDRMLATQSAIDEFAAQQNVKAAWSDAKQAGMTDAEFAAYQRSLVEAKDDAYDALLFKTMHRIAQRKKLEYSAEAKAIRAEATQAINEEPRFRALRLLRTGKLGDTAVDGAKLNSEWLVDRFGDDALDRLPKGPAIYSKTGIDADELAELTGFSSGAEMVQALFDVASAQAEQRAMGDKRQLRDTLIDNATNAAIEAKGLVDPLTDGSIEEEAITAISNDRQGEVFATELRHLARRTKSQPTPYRLARDWAKAKIEAGRVKDVASRSALQRYARAAAKSSRAFEEAIVAGNTDEAFRHKQAQMLNHALFVEAKNAADDVDTIVARMNKLGKRAAMKSVDQDYFDRVHELLEKFDFRPQSQRFLDEKEGFATWAANRIAQGYEVHVPPRLMDAGDHYSRVSVSELYGLRDTVDSLMSLGRLKQRILDAKKERDFNEFLDEIIGKIAELPDRKLPQGVNEDPSIVRGAMAELLKIETIAAELDGGDPHGPLTRLLVQRASDAETTRHRLRERTIEPIAKAYLTMDGKQRARLEEKITIPELPMIGTELDPRNGQPTVMTRMELLSVALNTGNASNFDKLARGEKWNPKAISAVLDREMTAFDWTFVQSIWDSIDSLWPEIAATERQLSGVVPEKVEATPIVNRHGTFRGGYYPVVYDFDRSQQAENYKADDINDLFGFASGVSTPKGHTISRTAAVGPIRRSVEDVVFRHVERVVSRIAYAEYARDVLRTIENPRVRAAIDLKLGKEYRDQIQPWLKRVVNSGAVEGRGARWMQRWMRQARTNMAIVAMGFRISTGVAQTMGLTATAGIIGPVATANGVRRMLMSPRASAEFVTSRSPEMERRNNEVNREISEFHKNVQGKTGLLTTAQNMAFWHIGMIDRYMVAMPTWLGAHTKGIDEGMTDEQASRYADSAVRQSQGSGAEKDLASVQSTANGEAIKWLTLFYTYFNVQFNAQWAAGRASKRGDWRKAMVMTGWFMVAAPLLNALVGGDTPDDPDDENGWYKWFARNVGFNLFSGIPLARDVAAYANRKVSGQFSSLANSPIARIADTTERAGKAAYDIYETDEMTGRQLRTITEAPGYFVGLPTGQAGATAGFLWDYHKGDAEPQDFGDWYTGITKGKIAEEKE